MTSSTSSRLKLIIDCDPGTDDAQVILMALAHDHLVELIAVTTVLGNATVENTTRNAVRILKFANRSEIPVYRGCSQTLLGGQSVNDAFHGQDGLGDVALEGVDPVDMSSVKQESAPLALVQLANKYPGEIVLLAIGPLTNLGSALALDENVGKKFKDCVVMGGNLNGAGNITRTAEFNFYSDPEAAQRVLQSWGKQITLLPLQICIKHYIPWDIYDRLVGGPNRTSRVLKSIDVHTVSRTRAKEQAGASVGSGYGIWDQLAMAVILRPDCVLEEQVMTAAVELTGTLTRGQMVLGKKRSQDTWKGVEDNVKVITKIDDTIFQQLLNDTISHEF